METSPAQTSATATGLSPGNYTVTIIDALGCTATASADIMEPTVLTAAVTGVDPTCNGGNDGSATAQVNGGTAPYSFAWNTSPAQTSATASALVAGTYTVDIMDVNGCQTSASITLNQVPALNLLATTTDVSCNGGNNGTAGAFPSGGTAPFSYQWNTQPVQTTQTAIGLAAGNYSV